MSFCSLYPPPRADVSRNRDSHSILTDPRIQLEECLGKDASPAVLEQHTPRIKQVIYGPLISLKAKQEPYEIAMAGKRKLCGESRPCGMQTPRVVNMLSSICLVLILLLALSRPIRPPSFLKYPHTLYLCTLPVCRTFHVGFSASSIK